MRDALPRWPHGRFGGGGVPASPGYPFIPGGAPAVFRNTGVPGGAPAVFRNTGVPGGRGTRAGGAGDRCGEARLKEAFKYFDLYFMWLLRVLFGLNRSSPKAGAEGSLFSVVRADGRGAFTAGVWRRREKRGEGSRG